MPSARFPYRTLLFVLLVALTLTGSIMIAACSPQNIEPSRAPTSTASRTPQISIETATPTERPTSDPPDVPPRIIAPADGDIIAASFPDFQFESPPRAWTVNIIIFNDSGYRQEYIVGVGAGLSGWMNEMFTPVTPAPLTAGTYQWYAVGCRQTAVGGCGPHSGTRTFTIRY